MTLPVEDFIAAFPPCLKAGNVTLRPLTLGGAIRLSHDGVDCGAAVPRSAVFKAAFILSGEANYRSFLRRAKCGLKELCNAVENVINDAFATYVKPAEDKDAPKSLTPHGLGWAIEVAEFLCGEYGWSWQEALDTPVATAWALAAASRQRHCAPRGGLDYVERWYAAERKAGRAKAPILDKRKEEAV